MIFVMNVPIKYEVKKLFFQNANTTHNFPGQSWNMTTENCIQIMTGVFTWDMIQNENAIDLQYVEANGKSYYVGYFFTQLEERVEFG